MQIKIFNIKIFLYFFLNINQIKKKNKKYLMKYYENL